MKLSIKFLPAIALAIALAPFAAQAQTAAADLLNGGHQMSSCRAVRLTRRISSTPSAANL